MVPPPVALNAVVAPVDSVDAAVEADGGAGVAGEVDAAAVGGGDGCR